jgi:UPF0716 protein FxsA
MPWMGRLLLLFILVPTVELVLLIEVGSRIGTLATLGLIAITGLIGASLARQQGLRVLRQVQEEIAQGRLPAGSLVDGLIILIAGALLITPGILTDAFGFLCLVPAFRGFVKRVLRRRFEQAVREQRVHVVGLGEFDESYPRSEELRRPGPAVDVEYEVESESEPDDRH